MMKKRGKEELAYLLGIIFLNLFSCLSSFIFHIEKFHKAPFNSLWEFFTINWCVWNSIITIFYSAKKIRDKYQQKEEPVFDLLIPTINLSTAFIFTLGIIAEKLGYRLLIGIKHNFYWWIYTIAWHYLAPLLSLNYFFKFTRLRKANIKENRILLPSLINLSLLLFTFLLTNLLRSVLAEKIYFDHPFKEYVVWWFKYINSNRACFSFFASISILIFWTSLYLLMKSKELWFPDTIVQFITVKEIEKEDEINISENLIVEKIKEEVNCHS